MFEPRFEIEQVEYDRMRSELDRLRARVAELESAGGESVTIRLTEDEALSLYFWTQGSDDCPDYWSCPLEPVGSALALWYREGAYPGWVNRGEGSE